jgi:5-hydroxyisourate hydrolase-like protein (transthyretin family)
MEKVPAGSVRVSAVVYTMSGTGRSSRVQRLEVLPGSEHEVQLEFVEGLAVSGMVSSDGVPAAGANVWFQSQEGNAAMSRTDGSGRYSVTGLEPGVYKVGASGINLSYEAEHTLTASGELDIDATGARLAGKVVDATSGSPIDAAEVSLWAVSGGETRPTTSASTGSGGAFTVSSVAPGTYRVLASKDGYGQDVREIELQRGATSELAFELAPAEGLSVEVVDARDGRALDAVVVVRDASRNVIANRHSGVGDDGTLTIPLSPGRYLLSTSATGYATATLPVTAPGRGLRVPLTPGGTLVIESARELTGRVRLVRPDGEEYVRCWCNGIAGIELNGRRTTTENVAPGSYTVEVVDAAGKPVTAPASVVIEEGRAASLQLK